MNDATAVNDLLDLWISTIALVANEADDGHPEDPADPLNFFTFRLMELSGREG